MVAKGVRLVNSGERVLRQLNDVGDALCREDLGRKRRAERLAPGSGGHEEFGDLDLGRRRHRQDKGEDGQHDEVGWSDQ